MMRGMTYFRLLPIFFILACQNQLGTGLPVTPTEETTGGGSTGGGTGSEENLGSVSALRTGDRFYVASVLTNLFIPTSVPAGEVSVRDTMLGKISTYITNQFGDFGHACDYLISSSETCNNNEANALVASIMPANSLRSAWTLRAVYEILVPAANEMGIKNILAQIRGVAYSSVSLTGLQPPTLPEIRLVLKLIYPGSEPSDDTLAGLLALATHVNQNFSAIESWRYMILAAMSPMLWQVP